jgi:hypothetical protein
VCQQDNKLPLPGGWENRMRALIKRPAVEEQLLTLQLPLHVCTANLAAAIAAAVPREAVVSAPRGAPLM